MTRELDLAVRVAALPLLGVLAVVGRLRDEAIRHRVRDDEAAAERATSWDLLSASDRALVADWTAADH